MWSKEPSFNNATADTKTRDRSRFGLACGILMDFCDVFVTLLSLNDRFAIRSLKPCKEFFARSVRKVSYMDRCLSICLGHTPCSMTPSQDRADDLRILHSETGTRTCCWVPKNRASEIMLALIIQLVSARARWLIVSRIFAFQEALKASTETQMKQTPRLVRKHEISLFNSLSVMIFSLARKNRTAE